MIGFSRPTGINDERIFILQQNKLEINVYEFRHYY